MTREQKTKIVSSLSEEFKNSDSIIVCEYKGLNTLSLEELRNMARECEVKVQVAKNTLASLALKDAGIEGIELKDTNIFIWSNDQLAICKVVDKFAKAHEAFKIKTAYIDGEITDENKVALLAKMPSRDELLAMLLQVWNAPITNFTIGLDALRAKKEEA